MRNFIIKIFINALGVAIAGWLLKDGVHVAGFGYAILIAFTLALLNASVKPLLVILTLPATLFSLGLFLFVINAAIILIADWIIKGGFEVDGWWWALLFSILLSILNSIIERLLAPVITDSGSKDKDVKIYDKDGNRIA